MSQEEKVGRWFNQRINTHYFEELLAPVHYSSDLDIRRKIVRVSNAYHDISLKLQIIAYHVTNINERVKIGEKHLPAMIDDLKKDVGSNLEGHRRAVRIATHIVEFYDMELVANLESFLIQSKALLDSFSQFYSVAFSRDIRTFSKKGKNFINDIKQLHKIDPSCANKLESLVNSAKKEWIDEVIDYRDMVVHYGQLRGLRCPTLVLREDIEYTIDDVRDSKLPNGKSINVFVDSNFLNIVEFSKTLVEIYFGHLRLKPSIRDKITGYSHIPRNSQCPCGSKVKYKRCHGKHRNK